ncbi:unnamed protein product [Owenia fusiformis]|uniref:Uncharacterized protein n=1 Tax=Owenia fusiformis TaxID=6347 RepID=A0A8J1U3X7_OWEFU|nr:unnamed protein product [Owenia fusiformis]
MIKNMPRVLNELSKFLGKKLPEEKIEEMTEYLQFEKMKNNPMTANPFEKVAVFDEQVNGPSSYRGRHMQKGVLDGWKKKMTSAQSERIDDYLNPRLTQLGLRFQYE